MASFWHDSTFFQFISLRSGRGKSGEWKEGGKEKYKEETARGTRERRTTLFFLLKKKDKAPRWRLITSKHISIWCVHVRLVLKLQRNMTITRRNLQVLHTSVHSVSHIAFPSSNLSSCSLVKHTSVWVESCHLYIKQGQLTSRWQWALWQSVGFSKARDKITVRSALWIQSRILLNYPNLFMKTMKPNEMWFASIMQTRPWQGHHNVRLQGCHVWKWHGHWWHLEPAILYSL